MAEQQQVKTKTEARVAAGGLVVSFSGGGEPKTWRADMAQILTASFELKETSEKYILLMKASSGTEEIYAFPDKDGAIEALNTVTRALFAQQASVMAPALAAQKTGGVVGKLFRGLLYLLVAAILIVVVWTTLQTHKMDFDPASLSTGVPMSADKMLNE